MENELENLWRKFSLTDEEQDIVELGEHGTGGVHAEKFKRCIVGRLLPGKPINVKALHSAMTGAWKINGNFDISDIGKGVFVCEFKNHRDKVKVLREAPWHYDRQLVILSEVQGDEQLSEVKLNESPFWIRLCNVPLNCRDSESITRIAERVGKVLEIREEDVAVWGKHIRVRVLVDVNVPLKRGTFIRNSKGEKVWVYFRFEKLPNFCYWCGLLGHVHDDCETRPECVEEIDWPYSPALRASPFRKAVGSKTTERRADVVFSRSEGMGDNENVQVRRRLNEEFEGEINDLTCGVSKLPVLSKEAETVVDNEKGEAEGVNRLNIVSEHGSEIGVRIDSLNFTPGRGSGAVQEKSGLGAKKKGGRNLKNAARGVQPAVSKSTDNESLQARMLKRKPQYQLQLLDIYSEDVEMQDLCSKKPKASIAGLDQNSSFLAETAGQSRQSQ
ncbi:uncharacterized protein LOC126668737 [Mercurialis annua]|nr:uncharacterized protein LOC126668737 [Mercurialis annua]